MQNQRIQPSNIIEVNKNENRQKITFIRHAQSLSNKAVHDFRIQRDLPDCWKTYHTFDDFNHRVIYNPDLCDCSISEKGQLQCLDAKNKIVNQQYDLILVSPLERALQTCHRILGDRFHNTKVIVQPLLAQSLKYSCDISGQIQGKQKRFPNYDFQNVKKHGDFWFLKNDDGQNQKKYFQHLDNYPHYSHEQKQRQIARFMNLTKLRQSNDNIRKRVWKLKLLLKQYAKNYKNIAVVSHYYTIRHIFAKNIAGNGEPLDQFYGPNCCIHTDTVQNLLTYDSHEQ